MTEKPTPKQPPSVPLGPALDWTDEEMDRLSVITPEDVEEAQGWVGRNAKPQDRQLWDAQAEETT